MKWVSNRTAHAVTNRWVPIAPLSVKVNVYQKDFVAKFREYRFDPSVRSGLVDHFNRTGQGRAAVGKLEYRMRYDFGESNWVFSIRAERT